LRKVEDTFLKILVNLHVLLLTLWPRLPLFAWRTDEKVCYKLSFVWQSIKQFLSTQSATSHLKTLELHGSRHTLGGAYATPPLGRIADRPVFIVTRVQSYDVGRCLGWSSNRHGWSWLPSPCKHLSVKGELYVPSVKSEPKTQTFPFLSPHVGQIFRRQNFVRTGHNIDLSPQPAK
jgi:hypothetical protein